MNSETRQSNYDKLPEDHDLILSYKPRFLNRGGEHLVYTVDGHPDVVIKASTYKIKDSVLKIAERGQIDDDTLKSEAENEYTEEIKQKNEEVRNLRIFFGKEHTLRERRYLMKVPVTQELLEEIFAHDYFKRTLPEIANDIKEVWTHVIVQEYTKAPEDPDKISLTYGFFIENDSPNPQQYQEVTNSIIDSDSQDFDKGKFLELQDHSKNKSLSQLITLSESDEQLREQLVYFVLTSIKYAEKTGQILALAGEDNVLFCKKDDKWNFVLLDALPNSPDLIFQIMKDLEQKLSQNINLNPEEIEYLKRGINFASRISFFSSPTTDPPVLITAIS
ncbi:MAG: hypothetical protein WCG60_01430 [bacterium]